MAGRLTDSTEKGRVFSVLNFDVTRVRLGISTEEYFLSVYRGETKLVAPILLVSAKRMAVDNEHGSAIKGNSNRGNTMEEKNKKIVIQGVMMADRTKWSAQGLQWLLANPFRLDLMMGLFVGHRRWLAEAGSPWRWDRPTLNPIQDPVEPAQHAQFWSVLSTTCSADYWSDEDYHVKLFSGNEFLNAQLSAFINHSQEIFEWAVKRILETLIATSDYPKEAKAFRDPSFGLRDWLRYKHDLSTLNLKWHLANLRAMTMGEFMSMQAPFGSIYLSDAVTPMFLRSPSKPLLKLLGAYELSQIQHLPTHLWKGKRLFAGTFVRTTQGDSFLCPCIDNRDDRNDLPYVKWTSSDTQICPDDRILAIA